MLENFITCALLLGSFMLLACAAHSDWKGMLIPNRYSLGIAGLFVLGLVMPFDLFNGISLTSSLLAALLTGMITLLLYTVKAMGGGDTKLATATSLLVGMSHLGLFLMSMAVTGGALAAYALLVRRQPRLLPVAADREAACWLSRLKQGENKVPYGIAIATGGAIALTAKWFAPLLG